MSVAPGASSADGSVVSQLGERSFVCLSVTGHDLVPGSTIRIEFGRDGRVRAHAGCNSWSGDLRWSGRCLRTVRVMSTEIACDRSLMDQDDWFAGLLQSGLDVDLAGDSLTLTGRGVRLEFIDRRIADPVRPLEGADWTANGIIAADAPLA